MEEDFARPFRLTRLLSASSFGAMWRVLPMDEGTDWAVAYRVAEQNGRLVVAEIRILPQPKDDGQMLWFNHSLDDPAVGLEVRDESGRVTAVVGAPAIPGDGLSARTARAGIRMSQALADARETLRQASRVDHTAFRHGVSEETLAAPRRPGRRGRPDRFYAEIAALYVSAVESDSRRPVKVVAAQLRAKGLHYSDDAVRDLIHDARRGRGMLTKPPTGQAGGQLTDKARALLADDARRRDG